MTTLVPAGREGALPERVDGSAQQRAMLELQSQLLPSRDALLKPFKDLDDEAKRRKLAARLEKLRREAPTSLRAHTQLIHRTDTGEPQVAFRHHAEWVRIAEAAEELPYVVVTAPPGYAKSSWFTVAYASWMLGKTGGRVRIGLVANTHSVARGFSTAIQAAVESPAFQVAYPDVRPDYERAWRDTEWCVTGLPAGPNFSLGAYGMNGPVQSRRFDLIILDDPTTEQQAWSKGELEKQKKWMRNTLIKRFPPGMRPPGGKGRMVVVLTRWAIDDLVPELKKLGFVHINMPAMGYWDREATCPNCGEVRSTDVFKLLQRCEHCDTTEQPELEYGSAPLWAALEDSKQLESQRAEDELMFELVMQGNPNVLTGDMFQEAWLQRGKPPLLEEYDYTIIGVDTASGKRQTTGDFFALARLGVAGDKVWVDEIDRARYNALQREDRVLAAIGLKAVGRDGWEIVDERLYNLKPAALVVEDKGEGTDLIQRLRARHLPLRIVDAQANKDKEYRASPLAGAYRNYAMWHPGYPNEEGEIVVPKWVRSYEAELLAFPEWPHDDQVDAVAHAYNHLGQRGPRVSAVNSAASPGPQPIPDDTD